MIAIPNKAQVRLTLDVKDLKYLQKIGGERGQSEFVTELLRDYQQRQSAQRRNKRLPAPSPGREHRQPAAAGSGPSTSSGTVAVGEPVEPAGAS